MKSYIQTRNEGIKVIQREKEVLRQSHNTYTSQLEQAYRAVTDSISYFSRNRVRLLHGAAIASHYSGTSMKHVKISYIGIPMRNDVEWKITAEMSFQDFERDLQRPISVLSRSLRRLKNLTKVNIDNKMKEYQSEALRKLMSFIETAAIDDYRNMGRLIGIVSDSTIVADFFSAFNEYMNALNAYRTYIPEQRLSKIARINIKALEADAERKQKDKHIYFSSLEGRLLSYATYMLESEKSGDENYLMMLYEKSGENLSELRRLSSEDVFRSLVDMKTKGYLNGTEYDFLKRELDKEFNPDEDAEYNVALRAMILEEDYGMSPENAKKIAANATDESVQASYEIVKGTIGHELARELFRNNPELALMEPNEIKAYVGQLYVLIQRGINVRNSPERFSSIRDVQKAGRKLDYAKRRSD